MTIIDESFFNKKKLRSGPESRGINREIKMPQYGFGNHHQSEALANALPRDQNSPQRCPFGLYAEQISGSAFTRPRSHNLSSWLYRLLPSVVQGHFLPYRHQLTQPLPNLQSPNPHRWSPIEMNHQDLDWLDSLFHIAGHSQLNAYVYDCALSMNQRYCRNQDGEMLIVPWLGELLIHTEFGQLRIQPGQIATIPRGVFFRIELQSPRAAGYVAENMGHPLILPDLGPIGANGLAHARHFVYPDAQFEDIATDCEWIAKFNQHWWHCLNQHSPLNVVAWHGNYAPYAYDLHLFNTMNTVSYDHADPSIFTVLTSPSTVPGIANLDFVIFPPRWMVAEHSFRPPYYHRNVMSELMGLIQGEYDAKQDGFVPGGISIHNAMTPHGPDRKTFEQASQATLKPMRYRNTLAFMFETNQIWQVTDRALRHPGLQQNYLDCWRDLQKAVL